MFENNSIQHGDYDQNVTKINLKRKPNTSLENPTKKKNKTGV